MKKRSPERQRELSDQAMVRLLSRPDGKDFANPWVILVILMAIAAASCWAIAAAW
jgi:hypothetical protein